MRTTPRSLLRSSLGAVSRCLFALALGLSASAEPQQGAVDFQLEGVTGTVRSPWPTKLPRGYAPVFVELWNGSERTVEVDLHLGEADYARQGASGSATTTVRLGPNEQRQLELLQPFQRSSFSYYRCLTLTLDRSSTNVQLLTGSEAVDAYDRLVAWVTPTPLAPGVVEVVAGGLNGVDSSVPKAPDGTTATGNGIAEWVAFEVAPRDLPSRAAAWSPIDVVVLDARGGAEGLQALALDALASHTRQGGLVVVLGDRAALGRVVGDVELLDARMSLGKFGGAGEAWRYGLGRVAWLPASVGEFFSETAERDLVAAVMRSYVLPQREGVYQVGTPAALERNGFLTIPGVGQLPAHLFVLLLVLFAVVIGPVNLFMLKRLGRPGLLVVTIPVISALTSLGLLAFGVLYQGIDLKGVVHSFTLLDQRDTRAVTLGRLALMPGLALGDLTPERGTTVHPTAYNTDAAQPFAVEHGDGLKLTGGWAPVRTLSNLLLSSDAMARGRVELERKGSPGSPGGSIELTNTLGAPIEVFTLRDADGAYWELRSGAPVAAGGKAALERVDAPSASLISCSLAVRALDVRASYMAVLSTNPFLDTLGIAPKHREEQHVIQGLLPLDEARWGE